MPTHLRSFPLMRLKATILLVTTSCQADVYLHDDQNCSPDDCSEASNVEVDVGRKEEEEAAARLAAEGWPHDEDLAWVHAKITPPAEDDLVCVTCIDQWPSYELAGFSLQRHATTQPVHTVHSLGTLDEQVQCGVPAIDVRDGFVYGCHHDTVWRTKLRTGEAEVLLHRRCHTLAWVADDLWFNGWSSGEKKFYVYDDWERFVEVEPVRSHVFSDRERIDFIDHEASGRLWSHGLGHNAFYTVSHIDNVALPVEQHDLGGLQTDRFPFESLALGQTVFMGEGHVFSLFNHESHEIDGEAKVIVDQGKSMQGLHCWGRKGPRDQ